MSVSVRYLSSIKRLVQTFPNTQKEEIRQWFSLCRVHDGGEGLTRSLYNIHYILTLYVMIIQQGSKIYYDQYRSTW